MRLDFSDFTVLVMVSELHLALNFIIKIPLGLYFLLGS